MQEKGSISIHTENIFPIIKKFLYSDHEIFLRELVSNATDATQKLKRLASLGEFSSELGDLTIQVKVDKAAKTITITDRGIGMEAEEVKKYINQVAFSGAEEFVEKFKDAQNPHEIIGKFGLGFYSAFMVAEKVEIQTRSFRPDAEPVQWICDGSTEFEINKGSRSDRGTDIILYINEDSAEFLEDFKIEEILNKYGRFLPVPIQFGTREEQEKDGEDESGQPKYKSVTVPNIINDTEPLWTKSPSSLNDEDYLKFYRELYPMSEPPLFWIHLNVDYPFTLTGILYFPKVNKDFELQRNKIKLFSRQVFITDEVKEIVPEFLMLLHGVIDSPDIPLNVSRSFLQADGNVKKINSYITKKVADKLNELFKADRKSFEAKWPDISLFVKYGMITDDKFYEKAKDFVLLESTGGTFSTLPEYADKVKALQTDKEEQLVYLYCEQPEQQYTFIQAAERKGYDVLKMDLPIDSHFVSQLEQKLEKTRLKRVDADSIENLIPKAEQIESVLSDAQKDQVKGLFESAVQNPDMEINVEGMHPEELPVTITMDEFMRRMKDMAKTGGGMMGMYGSLPDKYKVTVNGNHKLIQQLLAESDGEKQKNIARQAFDLALLSRNMLTGEALTAFVNRSVGMMA